MLPGLPNTSVSDTALIIKYFHLRMTHGLSVYILGGQIQLCDNEGKNVKKKKKNPYIFMHFFINNVAFSKWDKAKL